MYVFGNSITNSCDDAICLLGSYSSSTGYIRDSVISGNVLRGSNYQGAAIKLTSYKGILDQITVCNNTITGAVRGIAVWDEVAGITSPTNISIVNNSISTSSDGIQWLSYAPKLSSNSTVQSNSFKYLLSCIYIYNFKNLTFINNTFQQSGVKNDAPVFNVVNSDNISISSNTMQPNPNANTATAELTKSTYVSLKENTLYAGNNKSIILEIADSSYIDVEANRFESTQVSSVIVMSGTSDYAKITQNIFDVPLSENSFRLIGQGTSFFDNINSTTQPSPTPTPSSTATPAPTNSQTAPTPTITTPTPTPHQPETTPHPTSNPTETATITSSPMPSEAENSPHPSQSTSEAPTVTAISTPNPISSSTSTSPDSTPEPAQQPLPNIWIAVVAVLFGSVGFYVVFSKLRQPPKSDKKR